MVATLRKVSGWVPKEELLEAQRNLLEAQNNLEKQLALSAKKAESLIWIFGTGRAGSHWLTAMLEELDGNRVWHEPMIGELFSDFYFKRVSKVRRKDEHFVLGSHPRIWLNSIRTFVLHGAEARFPAVDGYLVIREPNGSAGAPLLMKALPESRMIFLIRDPRDVMASWLDAERKGGWLDELKAQDPRENDISVDDSPEAFLEYRSKRYLMHVVRAKQAYDAHEGHKVLVKYENLVSDPLGTMKRLYSELDVPFNGNELAQTVEKNSWENISEDRKGEGKFYRKGSAGGWKKALTEEQVAIIEEITAPLIEEFYSD